MYDYSVKVEALNNYLNSQVYWPQAQGSNKEIRYKIMHQNRNKKHLQSQVLEFNLLVNIWSANNNCYKAIALLISLVFVN